MHFVLAFVLLLSGLMVPINGEEPPPIYNQCDPDYVAVITEISDVVDYAAGCQTYTTCLSEMPFDAPVCQMRAQIELEKSCQNLEADDCRIVAGLYAAAITIIDEEANYMYPEGTQIIHNQLPDIFEYLSQQDDAVVMGYYLNITPYQSESPMVMLSVGMMYERVNLFDEAIEAYSQAQAASVNLPIIYYMRGHAYLRDEKPLQAALDFQMLAVYLEDDAILSSLAEEFTTQYPVETGNFEDWLLYPVTYHGSSPMGDNYKDMISDEPQPLKLMFTDDAQQLIVNVTGKTEVLDYFESLPEIITLNQNYSGVYETSLVTERGAEINIAFDFSGTQPVQVRKQVIGSESMGTSYFVLGLVSETDPRLSLGLTRCENAATSRLNVGQRGKVYFAPERTLLIYDEPGSDNSVGTIEVFFTFAVDEGPVCQDGLAWWKITTADGITGWVQESSEFGYQIYPESNVMIPVSCQDTLLSRLTAGDQSMVVVGQGANRVRNQPALAGEVVGTIPEGNYFEVLSGPVCVDGYAWWQVNAGDVIGWTAEGEGETYWLQPESIR